MVRLGLKPADPPCSVKGKGPLCKPAFVAGKSCAELMKTLLAVPCDCALRTAIGCSQFGREFTGVSVTQLCCLLVILQGCGEVAPAKIAIGIHVTQKRCGP